jgi:transposase
LHKYETIPNWPTGFISKKTYLFSFEYIKSIELVFNERSFIIFLFYSLYLLEVYMVYDRLHNRQQEKVQQISVEHTRKILGGHIGLVFYDVTTLYFETDYTDDLRERGFSKDGKHAQSQVVLGLFGEQRWLPSYSLFNGSQYESRTMLPIVEDFVQHFNLEDFVIVADSGLMNQKNIELLESGGDKYIIGARIENEMGRFERLSEQHRTPC